MRINEIRPYGEDFKLINMRHDDKDFAYSQVDGKETFEVYHLDDKKDSGIRYSRAYHLNQGETPPKKYNLELEFLKSEFNKINWDVEIVAYKLSHAQ